MPSAEGHAVLLVTTQRDPGDRTKCDMGGVWVEAPDARRAAIEALADLDTPAAFAAAVGRLERFRGERDCRRWKIASMGGSRTAEWWARPASP